MPSQLLTHYDRIISLLEKGLNVDTIYLDFAKAFDKVDHSLVLRKLSLLGIRGKILQWIVFSHQPNTKSYGKRFPL